MKQFMTTVGATFCGVVLGLVVSTFIPQSLFKSKTDFTPDVFKDVAGRVVVIPDPRLPGGVVGWYFDTQDLLIVKQLDYRSFDDDARRVVFVEVNCKTAAEQYLAGIMEIHYVRIAGKYYPVTLNSVDLRATYKEELTKKKDKPPVTKKAPPDKASMIPAHVLPSAKE